MVFIHSRTTDQTTIDIIEWLIFFGKKFMRFEHIGQLASIPSVANGESIQVSVDHSAEFGSYYFNGYSRTVPGINATEIQVGPQVNKHLQDQANDLVEFLIDHQSMPGFGNSPFAQIRVNKLKILKIARQVGFDIPKTAVVSSQQQVCDLKNLWGRIITKSMHNGIFIETNQTIIKGQKTEELTQEVIQSLSSSFFPSLVQQLIVKEFEVRVFYFRGMFRSLATFTQKNPKTVIDGRGVDEHRPNREVPFNLPEPIQTLIKKLMHELDINYGSLDFIYTPNGKFVFLEVNPYGQYGFLSHSANYYIERTIAEYL